MKCIAVVLCLAVLNAWACGEIIVMPIEEPDDLTPPATQPDAPSTQPPPQPATQSASRPSTQPTDFTSATLITLKLDNAPVDTVLEAIGKQIGAPLRPYNKQMFRQRGVDVPNISIDFNAVPFWTALKEVCEKGKIAPYFAGDGQRGMIFMPLANIGQSPLNGPISISGAAMSSMQSLSRSSSVNFATNESTGGSFNAQMMVMFEPRVRVSGYMSQARVDEAVDDKGNSLLPAERHAGGGMSNMHPRMGQASIYLPLKYPDNPGSKIARLRGSNRFNVATRIESVSFDLAGELNKPKKVTGRRMEVTSVKPQNPNVPENQGQQYLVQLVVYRDETDRTQFGQVVNGLSVRATDKADRELMFHGFQSQSNNGQEAKLTAMFYRRGRHEGAEETGAPATLTWDAVAESKEITIPFEFTDLPLP